MLKRLLTEPLVIFVALGAALFVAFAAFGGADEAEFADGKTIIVTPRDIAQLDAAFESVWRRLPTEDEREVQMEFFIRQEVLVREAFALGLDTDDSVIRQRLQQKMDFLLSSASQSLIPTDEDLQLYLTENAARYQQQAQVAFESVYLGDDPAPDTVAETLAALNSGADSASVGQRTLLPPIMPLTRMERVDATFGAGFSEGLSAQPFDVWAGPVRSGYGLHLVRVTGSEPARLPDLESVRAQLEEGWRSDKSKELAERQYTVLREGYSVEFEGSEP